MIFSVILVKSIVTQAAYRRKGFGVHVVPGNEGLWQPEVGMVLEPRLRAAGSHLHAQEGKGEPGRCETFEISNPHSAITSTNKHTSSTYPNNAADWGPGASIKSFSFRPQPCEYAGEN